MRPILSQYVILLLSSKYLSFVYFKFVSFTFLDIFLFLHRFHENKRKALHWLLKTDKTWDISELMFELDCVIIDLHFFFLINSSSIFRDYENEQFNRKDIKIIPESNILCSIERIVSVFPIKQNDRCSFSWFTILSYSFDKNW